MWAIPANISISTSIGLCKSGYKLISMIYRVGENAVARVHKCLSGLSKRLNPVRSAHLYIISCESQWYPFYYTIKLIFSQSHGIAPWIPIPMTNQISFNTHSHEYHTTHTRTIKKIKLTNQHTSVHPMHLLHPYPLLSGKIPILTLGQNVL